MINKKIILLLSLTTLLFTTSCEDDDETIYGNWVEASQFDGHKRSGAVSFTIGETVYLGLGYNSSRTSGSQYFSDFSSYDGGSSWVEQTPFPGAGRQDAFAFAVDGKGYVGCGYYNDTAEIFYSDVWEFTPTADGGTWRELPEKFTGGMLTEMTSFVVGGKAYVTGGRYDSDETKKDSYVFDSATGIFTKNGGMNYKRSGAFSFVIGDKAYVGGGYDNNMVSQFERFDATTGEWAANNTLRALYLPTSLTDDIDHYDDALDITRRWAVSFVAKDTKGVEKGYIASGNNGSILNDCWEYDPATDLWTEKNSFEYYMNARQKACSFILKGNPYILTGQSGSGYLDDMWYFEPSEEENEND